MQAKPKSLQTELFKAPPEDVFILFCCLATLSIVHPINNSAKYRGYNKKIKYNLNTCYMYFFREYNGFRISMDTVLNKF